MLFNSIDFILFFPITVSIYMFIPKKVRCIWLLITSYCFYMNWNPRYALLIGFSTIITYISGLVIEKCSSLKNGYGGLCKKVCVAVSLTMNLGILLIFKYADFIIGSVDWILSGLGVGFIDKRPDLLLPVGISFYTFQALSYTLDVAGGGIKAERNIFRYALFVSFFPQLVAGPIERSKNLLTQIQNIEKINVWNYERICNGLLLMLWGFFQKLVIADRVLIVVEKVYHNYNSFGFLEIFAATILFALQIYCDFGGYSNIARGTAQVMGFYLMQNFRQPYLAGSIKEFWRRWHISLSKWFTDYLYIPLGGNRKGTARKYWNIFVVFAASGMWHGASWNFLIWGMLHAFYQILEDINVHGIRFKIVRITAVFTMIDFAWIFFASDSLQEAAGIIKQMFSVWQVGGFKALDLDRADWMVLMAATIIVFLVDILHERGISVFETVGKLWISVRWILYLGLVWCTIMFGVYGIDYDVGQFIYFQF